MVKNMPLKSSALKLGFLDGVYIAEKMLQISSRDDQCVLFTKKKLMIPQHLPFHNIAHVSGLIPVNIFGGFCFCLPLLDLFA